MHGPLTPIDTPDGHFHDGNPATGALGTLVTADWLNGMQDATADMKDELLQVLSATGIAPDEAATNQLLLAIKTLAWGNIVARVASQAEAEAGSDNVKQMTALRVAQAIEARKSTSTSLIRRTAFARCLAAATLFSGSVYQPAHMNTGEVITASGTVGVLVNSASSGAWFDLVLPYMVLIGDSIAEGHPALHGRLHPNSDSYDPNYVSQPGQLSYEFAKRWGLPVVNQAIGGQTSTQVRQRWGRDVLAQTVSVGDGRGSTTLSFGGQLPYAVYLHVGINDIATDVPVATIKDNFTFFAQSCRDNGLLLIVDNIGADSNTSWFNATRRGYAAEINAWLKTTFKQQFPEVYLVDYLDWSSNGTGDLQTLRPSLFADDVHPTKDGYGAFAEYVDKHLDAPVRLANLTLGSAINGPTAFARVSGFTFNGNNYGIAGELATFELGPLQSPDMPVKRLAVTARTPVTGNSYMGFAQVYAEFTNRAPGSVFKPLVSSGAVAAGIVYHAALDVANWKAVGIASVDASKVASDGQLSVTFNQPVTHMVVTMAGSNASDLNWQFSPRWFSGVIPNGQLTWNIELRRIADSVLATNPIYHNYQIIGYSL